MGDPNDDLLFNCATGACCQTLAERIESLAKAMVRDKVCAEYAEAHVCAKWMLSKFDLAPAGKLLPLVREIARLAQA